MITSIFGTISYHILRFSGIQKFKWNSFYKKEGFRGIFSFLRSSSQLKILS